MTPDPLNSLAKSLLDSERTSPTGIEPDALAEQRIWSRLEALSALPTSGPASPPSAPSPAPTLAAKVGSHVVVLLLGAGLGVGGTLAVTRRPPPAEPPVTAIAALDPAPEQRPVPEAPPAQAEPAPAAPVAKAPKPVAAPPDKTTLKDEQVLLDTARSALLNRRAEGALEALQQHERRFPAGALTEEREALAIQALVMSGQLDAAQARAAKFKARFPTSIFGPAIDATLDPAP